MTMKLVLAIVQSDDARGLLDRLVRRGYSATVISTTGGFLREGNATIIVGVEEDRLEDVLTQIRGSSHTRKQYVNPLPPVMEPGELHIPIPVEVAVGGATVFVFGVERFEKF